MNAVIRQGIQTGINYREYRTLIDDLLAQGKTTGPNQSESQIHFTELNVARMNRLDKTTVIHDDVRDIIEAIEHPQTWLVITEAWCGDAAQIVPVINQMADLNPKITVKHVLRDENEALINLFLTNGAKSIPKIIVVEEATHQVIGEWGPRPSEIQEAAMARKSNPDAIPYNQFAIEVQKWYAKDRTHSIQREFATLLSASVGV